MAVVLVPASQVILQFLREEGLIPDLEAEGEEQPDWKGTYGGGMGDTPDQAISIADTVPSEIVGDMRSEMNVKGFGIQVMLRSRPDRYNDAIAKGGLIEDTLGKISNYEITVGGVDLILQRFFVTTGLWNFGVEKDGTRELFSVNGTCALQTATA
jgi:hypothetical protein